MMVRQKFAMHYLTTLLGGALTILLSVGCSTEAMNAKGTVVFKVKDNNIIEYANVSNDNLDFHSIDIFNNLPDAGNIEIVNILPDSDRDILVITRKHGIYLITDLGESVNRIDSGLPPEVIYPFKKEGVTKPIVSHSVSRDRKWIAVLVPSMLYLSSDGGRNFQKAPLQGVRRYTELMSVALHPDLPELILLGTATSGIYYSLDGGLAVRRIRHGVPGEPIRTPNFLEEIRSLSFGEDTNTFYAGFGSSNGVYKGTFSGKMMTKANIPPEYFTYPDGEFFRVNSLYYHKGKIWIGMNKKKRAVITLASDSEKLIAENTLIDLYNKTNSLISINDAGYNIASYQHYQPRRDSKPDKRALGKRGLYISYSFTQRDNYKKLITLLKYLKLNAVVINLKDDYGSVRVPVSNTLVKQVPDSVKPYKGVRETIKRLHNDGIYVIGRQVVFKDEKLYDFENGKYAVKNRGGFPLRKGPEKWVDAYSEFAWDYNIAVAKAIVKAGADEIQFDYIRFPDIRGKEDRRRYDFQKEHQTMREALVSFLKKAHQELDVPISIDLFGYNAVYKWGNWIGQDISELSRYVDVVSPMFYPSHYTGGFGASYGNKRIYYIIYLSCKRARELTNGVHLRPYIQAFYYKDNWDKYGVDYISWELNGVKSSGLSDYIFWNDLHEYTILIKGMRKYIGLGQGPIPDDIKKSIPKKLPFKEMVEK